ncbi:MAG: type II toxin-antitoxin system RelE/ParE family toxin [Rickettsiales bacterium]
MLVFKNVIKIYNGAGKEPFTHWLNSFKDKTLVTRILRRIDRVAFNNYGDHRYLTGGMFELKVDFGPGYRIYCGEDGGSVVILLCAGDKKSQTKDIILAKQYWQDYLQKRKV